MVSIASCHLRISPKGVNSRACYFPYHLRILDGTLISTRNVPRIFFEIKEWTPVNLIRFL